MCPILGTCGLASAFLAGRLHPTPAFNSGFFCNEHPAVLGESLHLLFCKISSLTASVLTVLHLLQQNNEAYCASGVHKPLPLGVAKRLVVLTCMDSRIIPEALLGLKLGDAEIIRNGGGRVTEDVIRSCIICQDMLECDTILCIHHTDCGGQHAVFHPAALAEHVKAKAQELLGLGPGGINMQPIYPGMLEESVREDVSKLRAESRIKASTSLFGLVLDTASGRLKEVCKG